MHKLYQMPCKPCKIIRIKKEEASSSGRKNDIQKDGIPSKESTSMSSLILWNISKALEMNPTMDLKESIRAAQRRLEQDSSDLNSVDADHPEQQHLLCALLAWQQLGHQDVDSLYRFIQSKRNEVYTKCAEKCVSAPNKDRSNKTIHESLKATNVNCNPSASKAANGSDGTFGPHSSGPVVKLPVETKLVMRFDNPPPPAAAHVKRCPREQQQDRDTISKIDEACCLESACVERLASLDATTKELRTRASKLARREAERVELLERAEAAWKDLEAGYQKRLSLAEDKEDDINRQIQKVMGDRNDFKSACTSLAQDLKDRGDAFEKQRAVLTEVEKQVCERACKKLRLTEEAAKGEASLAEQQCKAAQYERDLQFKEEQARRKLVLLENEADSARALTHEAERAMRAELSGLREQVAEVSNELLQEDELNVRIKEEHEQLRQEKMEIIEDLEGCKMMCDMRMQGRVDALNKKKEAVNGLKEQALECRCKLPVDAAVEVKRTPSLAALCRCAPEDKLLESCSCTSLRGRLLSNLLADLFGGLQTELGGSGSQMPCQLLKCLEDKHNWDRASVVKTNLRNFFSKLLMGELDIAIATSIENYHAKWVGASCADVAKLTPDADDDLKEGWQQRALEKRAQKMATELAEQLFQQRAEQLAQRARQIVKSGPPPCECRPPPKAEAAVFPCLMPSNTPFAGGSKGGNRQSCDSPAPAFWKRTIQDVTQLRLQIEDLKKDSIKKEDLKLMEEKIAKIVKQASAIENEDPSTFAKDTSHGEAIKKETRILRSVSVDESSKTFNQTKSGVTRKKAIDNNSFSKKSSIYEKPIKQSRKQFHGQSYAVNLCLCGIQKSGKQTSQNNEGKSSWRQKPSRDVVPQNSVIRQTKPINVNIPTPEIAENEGKVSELCNSNCKCFHKVPSNTSIDKLLETLARWKCDLADPQERCIKNIKSSFSKYSKTAIKESMRVSNQNDSKINLSISTESNKEQVNKGTEYDKISRSAQFRHPLTTESEYMGAVNLDKSNENICKCIPHIESVKENNQEKKDNVNDNVPFKCINTTACECKIYQEMQKDNKRSQTEESKKTTNQIEVMQSDDISGVKPKNTSSESNNYNQKEMKRRSDVNNVSQKTEIFGNCDYYIKFLGVTLDDLGSHKKTKRLLKDVNHNVEDLLLSKDKYMERRRKLQRKLSGSDPSNTLSKSNIINHEESDQNEFDNTIKCECNAKLEEFKKFMNTFFISQMHQNTRNDEGLDAQSFKYTENKIESCVCCNSYTVDDSKDLEVNAFHLLEDHLKGKLEEFKSFSCKSSCIPPEEEEKLFSAILKRVKQVISDCANEMKCACPGTVPNDGSWNRAYGLLQEYLKIKIKRVQCLCVLKDNKEVILPEILDKVCNLIENDFQRLKDICQCKNSNETRKKCVRIEDLASSAKELPEKDTNTSRHRYDVVEVQNMAFVTKLSKQNSNKSMIQTENISSQVPPNLGMEAKSCDVMEPENMNAQTTETDTIITDNKANGVMYNKCDCCYNTDKNQFSHLFRTKEVLVNICTDEVKYTNTDICDLPKSDTKQDQSVCPSIDDLKPPTDMEKNETDKSKPDKQHVVDVRNIHVPYIGYTVDCTCDNSLGSCVCMKSVVQANNDKIDNIWKEYLANCNNCTQDFSYIMDGTQNEDEDVENCHTTVDGNDHTAPEDVLQCNMTQRTQQKCEHCEQPTCETEVVVENDEDVILINSHEYIDTIHHTTNTFDESISQVTSNSTTESPIDWFSCALPITSRRASTAKLTNSIYFPAPIDNSLKSETVTDIDSRKTLQTPQSCDCDRVPICHVKLLVENIEKNLIESKCTCDSLISKVCPVHSKRITST